MICYRIPGTQTGRERILLATWASRKEGARTLSKGLRGRQITELLAIMDYR